MWFQAWICVLLISLSSDSKNPSISKNLGELVELSVLNRSLSELLLTFTQLIDMIQQKSFIGFFN